MGDFVWIDEIAKFDQEDWDKLVARVKAREVTNVSWRHSIITWEWPQGSILDQYLAEKRTRQPPGSWHKGELWIKR